MYDVLVFGKMVGYYMMFMMVICIICFNDILWILIWDLNNDGLFVKGVLDL